MKAGDFMLIQGKSTSVIEDAIALVEHSPWVHVETATSDNTYLNPVWPHILEQKGVLVDNPPLQRLVQVGLSVDEQVKVAKELRKFRGQHYGARAFLWAGLCIILPFLRHLRDPLPAAGAVCSTSLALAYYNAGIYDRLRLGDQAPESVSPADLARAWGL